MRRRCLRGCFCFITRASAGPQGVQGKIDQFFELNSWAILDSAKNGVERAFWGLVMPSIAGIKGMSETVGDMIGRCATESSLRSEGRSTQLDITRHPAAGQRTHEAGIGSGGRPVSHFPGATRGRA